MSRFQSNNTEYSFHTYTWKARWLRRQPRPPRAPPTPRPPPPPRRPCSSRPRWLGRPPLAAWLTSGSFACPPRICVLCLCVLCGYVFFKIFGDWVGEGRWVGGRVECNPEGGGSSTFGTNPLWEGVDFQKKSKWSPEPPP